MYTLQQQTFALSMLSNALFKSKGSIAQLQAAAKTAITEKLTNSQVIAQIGSSWQIVWGPIVFQETPGPDSPADNTMMVFRGTNNGGPVYVVAVAGTASVSDYDLTEDTDVKVRAFDGGDAWISQGTFEGVQILEGMTDSGVSLQSFLNAKAASGATLIFTGHSLGGALAPTLALDLVVNRGFDLTKWQNVFVYPSAGPTPGNQAFSTRFGQTFPQQTGTKAWNSWNKNVVNSLDIVPLAWNAQNLQGVQGIYPELPVAAGLLVLSWVEILIGSYALLRNVYATLPSSQFDGIYNPLAPTAPPLTVKLPNGRLANVSNRVPNYWNQAYYQHITGYLQAIVPDLAAVLNPAS